MKGPSLQKTAAVSAALHVTVFLLSALLLKHSNHITLPSPYVVNLVDQHVGPHTRAVNTASAARRSVERRPPAQHDIPKDETVSPRDEQRVEDMISALAAKRKIRSVVALREKMLSIKAGEGQTKKGPLKSVAGPSQGMGGDIRYEDKIRNEIHRQWFCPDTGSKNLEAIISLTIRKDGSIANIEIEKRSGSRLFNNCALQAIAKASPVTPPPDGEMSIGIRFYP
jgi:TonB family protein